VIDTRCDDKVATVSLFPTNGGGASTGVAVSPNGTRVYAAVQNSQSVKVIDAASNTVVGEIPTGVNPVAFGQFISPGVGAPPPPDPVVPAQVTGIEVTQGIQDVANTVPLVLLKRAIARVYVQPDNPAALPNVTARLSGLGAYETAGGTVTVPLGSLTPSNPGGPRITVPATPQRANLNDSFMFELPWEWRAFEALRLHATLSTTSALPVVSCPSEVAAAPLLSSVPSPSSRSRTCG
jgi:YVTN family beta-propeller protein